MAMGWGSSSPTVETVAAVLLVFLVQTVATAVGFGIELFALAAPLDVRPWTLVTSVYAHGNLTHLAMNAVALLVFGLLIERVTTRLRFHAFIIGTGAVAGSAEVLVGATVGSSPLVLGISGAVFALMGYLVAGNPVTDAVVGWLKLDRRLQFLLILLLAGGLTYVTGGENVALVAHFTGFVLGLMAGRLRLLHVGQSSRRRAVSGVS